MRIDLGRPRSRSRAEALTWRALRWELPELPGLGEDTPRRWEDDVAWRPPGTVMLARHRAIERPHWLHSNSIHSPRGYVCERHVGWVNNDPMPSTRRLTERGSRLRCEDEEGEAAIEDIVLGHVEQLPFVLLAPLELRRVPETGQEILVSQGLDPMYARTEPVARLGYVETVPIAPLVGRQRLATWGLEGLRRRLDLASSRHLYDTLDPFPVREPGSTWLGSVWHGPAAGLVALEHGADGLLTTELLRGSGAAAGVGGALRWTAAPLRWSGPRWGTRATAARAVRLARARRSRAALPAAAGGPLGWLRRSAHPGWSPLFSAVHPVVGDQFLSRSALEASDLGYRVDGVLGYICDTHADRGPVPGPDIPWASRFGRSRRYVEGPLPG